MKCFSKAILIVFLLCVMIQPIYGQKSEGGTHQYEYYGKNSYLISDNIAFIDLTDFDHKGISTFDLNGENENSFIFKANQFNDSKYDKTFIYLSISESVAAVIPLNTLELNDGLIKRIDELYVRFNFKKLTMDEVEKKLINMLDHSEIVSSLIESQAELCEKDENGEFQSLRNLNFPCIYKTGLKDYADLEEIKVYFYDKDNNRTGLSEYKIQGEYPSNQFVCVTNMNNGMIIVTIPNIITDLQVKHWSYEAIRHLVHLEVIQPDDRGKINPDEPISRGEFVDMLSKASGFSSDEFNPGFEFRDVPASSPYFNAIAGAVNSGILYKTIKFEDKKFQPDQIITREEMAAILSGYSTRYGRKPLNDFDISLIKDIHLGEEEYKHSIKNMYSLGILTGVNQSEFAPKAAVTREQAAMALFRLMNVSNEY